MKLSTVELVRKIKVSNLVTLKIAQIIGVSFSLLFLFLLFLVYFVSSCLTILYDLTVPDVMLQVLRIPGARQLLVLGCCMLTVLLITTSLNAAPRRMQVRVTSAAPRSMQVRVTSAAPRSM